MKYDFGEAIDRCKTNSLKYDFIEERGYPADILPLWVADMDFKIPHETAVAIKKSAEHGIYGYTEPKDSYYRALSGWFEKHFDYPIRQEWVLKTPGVVFALSLAVRAFTKEGDAVLIQRPVYHPFSHVVLNNDRKLINNPLVLKDGKYCIDFDDFEKKIVENNIRLFIFCSPHNPVGRVWTTEELTKIAEICIKHHCIVVSDEIHCDFVLSGHKHRILSSLSQEIADNTILCTAPSKTFNLAGLQAANIVITNPELRKQMYKELTRTGYSQLNSVGLAACQSSYEYGEGWLSQLKEYLGENLKYIRHFLAEHLPQVKLIEPEGTYLLWLDFRETGIEPSELDEFMKHKAKLWLNSGEIFGKEGLGFQRLNIACPRTYLEQAMIRLKTAIDSLL
ncbi:MAG: aminotransferase [Clostridiales bacterium 43-6]|nr:MAG: aminotransferase [Clostridiales bacterium 43-6]